MLDHRTLSSSRNHAGCWSEMQGEFAMPYLFYCSAIECASDADSGSGVALCLFLLGAYFLYILAHAFFGKPQST